MASHPPAKCCTVGVKHEGEPTGQDIKIDSIQAYLATPDPSNAHEGRGILYSPDVIGVWQNARLMADQYAANGYLCLIVDLFNGDPLPLNFGDDPNFNIMSWIEQGSTGDNPHTPEFIDRIVSRAIEWLKVDKKITHLGAVGYCIGAKYVIRHFPEVQVGYIAHPAFVTKEELAGFKAPLSIAAAETDGLFTAELRHKSEDILAKNGQPYQISLYSHVAHGFSVRCDISKKVEKFAKDQAFLQAIAWFDSWLL